MGRGVLAKGRDRAMDDIGLAAERQSVLRRPIRPMIVDQRIGTRQQPVEQGAVFLLLLR